MWYEYVNFLSSSVVHTLNADSRMADEVQQLLREQESLNSTIPQVNIGDVESCISRLKLHKAAGRTII